MSICNKYNIPEDTLKKMVKDGVVSSHYVIAHEVYDLYKILRSKSPNKSKSDIYYEIADSKRIAYFSVKAMVSKLDKI